METTLPWMMCLMTLTLMLLAAGAWAADSAPGTGEGASDHDVKIARHKGRTVITVDGKPLPGIALLTGLRSPEDKDCTQNMALQAGIKTILVSLGGGWEGPGKWDFTGAVKHLQSASKLGADIWLIPRICIDAPMWWVQQHPDQCAVNAHGTGPEMYASMGSPAWVKDSSEYLAALVRALEASPASKRILGYSLMTSHGGEWIYVGAGAGKTGDYSKPSLEYFHRWLRNKYGDQKWIDQTPIPTEEERMRSQPALLRDPKIDARVIDYDLAFSDMTADNLLAWCHAVKQVTGGRRLTGAFYGYILWQTGLVNATAHNGHLALRKVLESPDLDFITSFPSYDVREPGSAAPILVPIESIQAAGKLVFDECDDRTHKTGPGVPIRFHMMRDQRDPANGPQLWSGMWNLCGLEDQGQSLNVLRREYVQHLIRGSSWWWFDMGGNWYATPEIMADFKKEQAIAQAALDWDMSSSSQVAGVVSGTSPATHSMSRMYDVDPQPSFVELNADMSTREMYKAGAPIDWWMSEDLARPEMAQYKALYFHNATVLSDAQRKALDALKRDGRAMIFVGYPGLVAGGALDAKAASDTVGIRLKLVNSRAAARLPIKDYNLPCMKEALAQIVLGGGVIVSPRLIVDDPDAQIIATWPDGEPAAAVKRHKNWTAYYFPVPPNNAYVFRGIFRDAGVHIYTHNTCRDIVYANKSLLAVHSIHYGQPINLPGPARVTDLFTDHVVGEKIDRIDLGRSWQWAGGTHLFRVEYDKPAK
ncbi:MAG: beta-galactosidase [Planctomycetota bacterium]|nr:beta-galactosidase [Planctomycetota bacterium]